MWLNVYCLGGRADRCRADGRSTEQVSILAEAGVDLIVLETFTDVKEISAAIEAINEIGLLFIAQMSFGTDGKTTTGTSPMDAAML